MSATLTQPSIDPKALLGASRKDLVDLAIKLQRLKAQASQIGPQTDDELHAWVKRNYGIHIPRIAVTQGHDAPFDFFSDAVFQRETSQFVIANREGSKTSLVALIHDTMAQLYPGYEGITAGAIQIQSKRCYSSFKSFIATRDSRRKQMPSIGKQTESEIDQLLQSETFYKNGSKVEIVVMTYAAMNGPHSNLLHRDEIELVKTREAFDEGDNITKSGWTRDGRRIKAHDILTSTRKRARGLVQEVVDKCEAAVAAGRKPPYRIYKWGIAETVERVPNCRFHNPHLPEHELCVCASYVNDEMPDGSPRTLEKICGGRFGLSDGWRPLDPDICGKFDKNSPAMWAAQHECEKVASEGLILPNFSDDRNGIRGWHPNPEIGPIYIGVDFGGTNPHAVNFYQLVTRPTSARGPNNEWVIVPAGSIVCFDEIYITEIGNIELATMTKAKLTKWQMIYEGFDFDEIYADIAAKAARIDWAANDLPCTWRITREVEDHILKCQEIVDARRFFVDIESCPMFCDEAESWQRDPQTGRQIDTYNHCMSDFRYTVANLHRKLQIEEGHSDGAAVASDNSGQAKVKQGDVTALDITKPPETGPATRSLDQMPVGLPIHHGALVAR